MKKRVLSALLALCLAFSLVGTAWAADSEQATPETAQADVLTVSEETDAAEPTPDPTEEPAATATPDPTATPAPTEAPAATATPEPSDAPEETEDSEPPAAPLAPATAETAVAFDAAQALDNGVKVSVQAAAGVLPEGAQLQAEWLEDAERLTELEDALGEAMEYDGFVAVDICFTLDGETIKPEGDVQVAIELPAGMLAEDADTDTLALVHFAQEGETLTAELVDAVVDTAEEPAPAANAISLMSLDAATTETAAADTAVTLTFSTARFSPFAVAWQAAAAPRISERALADHTVQGVTPFGTTINLFDYWVEERETNDNKNWNDNLENGGINENRVLKFGKAMGTTSNNYVANSSNVNHWTGNAHPRTGIVNNKLGENDYPTLTNADNNGLGGESLSYLFDNTKHDGKAAYMDVGGLLQVDRDGYFYYDSKKNFAEFNETTKNFTLYDTWGVNAGGTSPNGQFFPFNDATDVFTESSGKLQQNSIKSTDSVINHYFGMTMSTRFLQQYGGHTDETEQTPVTYNFSGDDDVWIFIDDVLVGDLGGIHDASSIEINFASGDVIVYHDQNNNNEYDSGETEYSSKKLGTLLSYNQDTLPDNTYHTLDFFYLERGNTDSNLSLKYNLVTIPETSIQKVDQLGNPIAGAEFELKDKDTGATICTATTGADGTVVLLDENDTPITLQQLWHARHRSLTLTETNVPAGYRPATSGDISLRLEEFNTADGESIVVLLSDDPWSTGVYAMPKTTVTTAEGRVQIQKGGREQLLDNDALQNGTLFAVVEKETGDNVWTAVYGDPLNGWAFATQPGEAGAIEAAKITRAQFVLSTSGAYQVEIENLPGRMQQYQFITDQSETKQFRISYYYTDGMLDNANVDNTWLVTNSNSFDRQMSARLYIPNIINRIAVQKIDSVTGKPVNGATIALYRNDAVTVDAETGKATVNEDAEPLKTDKTRTLTLKKDNINLGGGVVFANLESGTYWVKETVVPEGYTLNENMSKVIVDSTGVYADAGVEDDGIQVVRGIGRLVRSMLQFAVADRIDVSLHNIIAQPQTGTKTGDTWSWSPTGEAVHLKYNGNPSGNQMDYVPEGDGENYTIIVDTDIPRLQVSQCKDDHKPVNGGTKQDLSGKDLTNLFTGTTIVQIADDPVGSLIVSKTVAGEGADQNKEFTFNIALTAPQGGKLPDDLTYSVYTKGNTNPVQKDQPFTGGKFTVKLKHDQYVVVEGLEIGTRYTVEETKADHYTPSVTQNGKKVPLQDGEVTGEIKQATGQGATHTAESVRLDYTNTYQTYILTVNKTVGGAMGDTSKDNKFEFTLTLTKGGAAFALEPVPNGLIAVQNETGKYTFELASGDTIAIELPEGVQAVVTEEDRTDYTEQSRKYETPAEGANPNQGNFTEVGTQTVTMDNNYTVDFQNIRDVVIPTGLESNHTKPYALMVGAGALAGLALVGGILARRARRRREW